MHFITVAVVKLSGILSFIMMDLSLKNNETSAQSGPHAGVRGSIWWQCLLGVSVLHQGGSVLSLWLIVNVIALFWDRKQRAQTYKSHRFPVSIVAYAIWLYFCFKSQSAWGWGNDAWAWRCGFSRDDPPMVSDVWRAAHEVIVPQDALG